jgi:hypothetical protein
MELVAFALFMNRLLLLHSLMCGVSFIYHTLQNDKQGAGMGSTTGRVLGMQTQESSISSQRSRHASSKGEGLRRDCALMADCSIA